MRGGVDIMSGVTAPAGAENPSRAQAIVIVDELARCGVRHAVLAPGSRSAALAMALHEDPRLALHVEVDERSAAFAALGIAKATGEPSLVLTTSGTATANLYPAVMEADAAAVPLLVVTADRPPELRATGANQTVDQVKLYGDRVRWYVELGVAEDRPGVVAYWRSTMSRAWAEAAGMRGPAGPVHVNVPTREPTVPASDDGRAAARAFAQPLHGRGNSQPWTSVRWGVGRLPTSEISRLAGRIAGTERGLIVVGDCVRCDRGSGAAIAGLAQAAGWPVIAEPTSGLRGSGEVIATAGLLVGHQGFARRHRPDFVVRIGRTSLSPAVARLLGPDVPQLLIDADGSWHDPDRAIRDVVVADPVSTAESLCRELAVDAGSDWADEWREADVRVRARLERVLDELDEITEPRVARDVSGAVPAGGTLVVSSSMPIRDLNNFMVPRADLRVLANRGASGIDGVVSTMLGVALGSPDAAVVGLLGDLALLHDAAGFGLRPGVEPVDLTLVVVNNNGGGIFSFLPQADYPLHFETVFGTPHGARVSGLAAMHDLAHTRVTDATKVAEAVLDSVAAGGVRLVEVITDRSRNAAVHSMLRGAVDDELRDWA